MLLIHVPTRPQLVQVLTKGSMMVISRRLGKDRAEGNKWMERTNQNYESNNKPIAPTRY